MNLPAFIKKNALYQTADEINEICKPLLKKFNLNYFSYMREYPDGRIIWLSNIRDWHYHAIEQEYYKDVFFPLSGTHLWSDYVPKKHERLITEVTNDFNYANGITICKPRHDYHEFIEFAAPSSNHKIMDFYFNQQEIINNFMLYFKDKAHKIITKAHNERFSVGNSITMSNDDFDKFHEGLLDEVKPSKIRLTHNSNAIILSKREYAVLLLTAEGKTAKEASRILNISYRTVEDHLAKIRSKSKCMFKSQLIDMLKNNQI